MKSQFLILLLTALFSALMAGLFYAYSVSVVPGLHLLPDDNYIRSMQSINKAIQNPVFFTCFFGILLLLPLSTYLFRKTDPVRSRFLLGATLLYFAGVFGVTILGNIPLNNALEQFNLSEAGKESVGRQRILFEASWNTLNLVRTFSSMASLLLVLIACIYPGRNKFQEPFGH